MAFNRPSLSTLVDRIKADIKSGLGLQAILRRSFEDVIAKALGGASHTLHGHIQYGIENDFFPDTGNEETVIRWGTLYGTPRNDATFAQLNITISGTTGGTLVVGTEFQRSDGVKFLLDAEVTVGASPATASGLLVAVDAGADGNTDDAAIVSLTSPVAGVETDAVVDSTAVEGEDQEDIEDYRVRVLERLQSPPSGGTVNDYISYAKTVTSVTRVWVLPDYLGAGTVGLSFVEDGNAPASIIPSPAKVTEVQDAVTLLKPITADLFTFAPNETLMNPVISLKPNTADVRAAITAELEDLIFREAQVRNAVNPALVGMGTQYTGKIPLSKINEAISIATGEDDHVLTFPTSNPQPGEGGILTLGTITFNTLA